MFVSDEKECDGKVVIEDPWVYIIDEDGFVCSVMHKDIVAVLMNNPHLFDDL